MLPFLVTVVLIMFAATIALPFLAFGFALLIKTFFFCAICFALGYVIGRGTR